MPGPELRVFLASGPMTTWYCNSVHTMIKRVRAANVHAYFLDQRPFLNGSFGPKCCGHPSIKVDTAMAASGAAFIKAAMGW